MVCLIGLLVPIVSVEIRWMMNILLRRQLFVCRVTLLLRQHLTQTDVVNNPPAFGRKTLLSSGRGPLWRACCYFIILSVLFPDGDRSLLAFRQISLRADVDWALLLFSTVCCLCPADRRLLLPVSETTQSSETTGQSIGGEPSGRPTNWTGAF